MNGHAPASHLCLDDASYVLGALSPAERQVFEKHLATCPACQASVARLAGLPGLLALTSLDETSGEQPPVPQTLLPNLLAVAARERRRRRWVWTGSMVAAAACVVALVVVVVVRGPGRDSTALPPLPPAIPMQQVVAGPMNATVQLVDKQWGTSIVVNCEYAGARADGGSYQLVVFDRSGKEQLAGNWTSVAGGGSTVWTSSSLRLSQISRVEVQWPNGKPVLTVVPHHA
ncbi:anti-sigma factor [Nakamurella sp. PAMC28650]|jgi:hypothetical protein|uniref:anti-sigma factor family protein n=1 Tax=Nakamurella sp. PAMC28650 TaxID=2762325 RepID=UPI00164DDDA5|nr:zf-HC2 domain-containing protein [Nakamurella sp. PAMC28650]QNK82975.1 zf-HC2 domain-containing protein [Nakamurella sp. PAMC28650]